MSAVDSQKVIEEKLKAGLKEAALAAIDPKVKGDILFILLKTIKNTNTMIEGLPKLLLEVDRVKPVTDHEMFRLNLGAFLKSAKDEGRMPQDVADGMRIAAESLFDMMRPHLLATETLARQLQTTMKGQLAMARSLHAVAGTLIPYVGGGALAQDAAHLATHCGGADEALKALFKAKLGEGVP